MITLPTTEQLAAAAHSFDQDWGGVDDVLYRLCAKSPGHSSRRTVTAKLALVGRAYSAGLERCVTPPKGEQAITVIADFVTAHGNEVDAIIEPVRLLEEPLTDAALKSIVAGMALSWGSCMASQRRAGLRARLPPSTCTSTTPWCPSTTSTRAAD